ncbi:MAG: hypothetical protein K2P20_00765 [Oscillospiraceae bacterium]|nr:hypothetical protein [Oscillospiraceae bacterium]
MNDKKHGFLLQSTRDLPELSAKFYQLEHEKSGAQLVWLERAEENGTCGTAFQAQILANTGTVNCS